MTNFAKVVPALILFALPVAHAQLSPKAEACDELFVNKKIDGTRALVKVESKVPLQELALNYPIDIVKTDYRNPDGTRLTTPARKERQNELARKGGELLAAEILKVQGLDSDQANVEAVMVIGQLGKAPKNALDSFDNILTASLSELDNPSQAPTFEKDTKNALGELTRVVTSYRTNAFDVNWLTNWMFKLGFKNQSAYLRTHFQSVKQAATAIDETLETSIGLLLMRHFQMLDARVQLKAFERFSELTGMMGLEAQNVLEQYMIDNDFTPEQKSAFEKNAIKPLADRTAQLVRERAIMSLAYAKFTLLMDGNLSLISVISNIRETANLEITVFGAAKIIMKEQHDMLDQANATQDSLDEMRVQSIAQLKQNGIMIRSIPDRQIKSMNQMVDQIGQLENELTVAQDYNRVAIDKYRAAIGPITAKLDDIAAKADGAPVGSLIDLTDRQLSTAIKRKPTDIDQMPTVTTLTPPTAAN